MGVFEAIILAVVLSLDAFAVALSIGMCQNFTISNKFRFLFIIGIFHFIMPLIGWGLAGSVHSVIEAYDHWVSVVLLAYLGGKMIIEGASKRGKSDQDQFCCYMSLSSALMFGVALSIDAVIAGFSLGMTKMFIVDSSQLVNILIVSAIIGVCAFFITMLGLNTGRCAGSKLGQMAEIFGGSVLIIIGLKTLITHLIT